MSKTYKCRRCKAPLLRSKHIVFDRFEEFEQLVTDSDPPRYRTVSQAVYKHVPCTNCGDPQPLNTIAANLPAVLTMALIFTLILGGGFAILFL